MFLFHRRKDTYSSDKVILQLLIVAVRATDLSMIIILKCPVVSTLVSLICQLIIS